MQIRRTRRMCCVSPLLCVCNSFAYRRSWLWLSLKALARKRSDLERLSAGLDTLAAACRKRSNISLAVRWPPTPERHRCFHLLRDCGKVGYGTREGGFATGAGCTISAYIGGHPENELPFACGVISVRVRLPSLTTS